MKTARFSRSIPAQSTQFPAYRHHKARDLAVVTIAGRDVYLGKYGSSESRQAYDRHVAEWLARGRPTKDIRPGADLFVSQLILAFWHYVEISYSPETREGTINPTLRRLRRLYGNTRVVEFGPLAFKALRQAMVNERDDKGGRLSRSYVNRSMQWVRRLFRWGVGEELVEPSILQALEAVEPLRIGRTDAPETTPVSCVPDELVEKTIPHLPPVIAQMVRLQRLTGMRPGEVCALTTGELDLSGEVWMYTPRHHKTAHHGKKRVIPFGPRAQEVLRPYLRTELEAPVFSPRRSEADRKANLRANRKTPMTPSQRKRDERVQKRPRQNLANRYSSTSYGHAIWRACRQAGLPHWSPNRLRHTRATELRKSFGLDAAGAVLGHSRLETTQIYAERSVELAAKVALATG